MSNNVQGQSIVHDTGFQTVFQGAYEGSPVVPTWWSCSQVEGCQVLSLFQPWRLYFDQFYYIWVSCRTLSKSGVLLLKICSSSRQSPHSWQDTQSLYTSISPSSFPLYCFAYSELLTHHSLNSMSWSLDLHCDVLTWNIFPLSIWKMYHLFI